jgi:hypothetical protein
LDAGVGLRAGTTYVALENLVTTGQINAGEDFIRADFEGDVGGMILLNFLDPATEADLERTAPGVAFGYRQSNWVNMSLLFLGDPGRGRGVHRLVAAVQSRGEQVAATQSIRARGPVLSGVLDEATGTIFYGQNTGIPSDLHPLLRARLNALLQRTGGAGLGSGAAGAHAEINALNQALLAREAAGLSVTEATLGDYVLFNIRLRGAAQGAPIPKCPNCRDLTRGVESVGH